MHWLKKVVRLREDMMLIDETKCPAMVAGISHMGNVGKTVLLRWLLGVAVAGLLTGCAQSYHQFYTEESRVKVPAIVGEWDVLKALGDDMTGKTIKPWVVAEVADGYEVAAYETNGIAATLEVVCFKTANQIYCDVTAGAYGQAEPNRHWMYSIIPVHTVWKIGLTNDTLVLTGFNYDWLKQAIETNAVALPFLSGDRSDERLYTATPEQWQKFLAAHGTNTAVFDAEPAYVFKKHAPAKPMTVSPPASKN